MERIIGVDPGSSSGAIAILNNNITHLSEVHPMPKDLRGLHDILMVSTGAIRGTSCILYIEEVTSYGMGSLSAFRFGGNYFSVKAMCYPEIEVKTVRPQVWQKEFGLITKRPPGMTKNEYTKQKKLLNYEKALELFPDINWPPIGKRGGLAKRMAVADAILIAEYGRRQEDG